MPKTLLFLLLCLLACGGPAARAARPAPAAGASEGAVQDTGAALPNKQAEAAFASGGRDDKIMAGEVAPEGRFPYICTLRTSQSAGSQFCAGSLIHPQLVLTGECSARVCMLWRGMRGRCQSAGHPSSARSHTYPPARPRPCSGPLPARPLPQ